MFVHIFSFVWKDNASPDEKSRAIDSIRSFEGTIPGLTSVLVGNNVSKNSPKYDTTGVMIFENMSDFRGYVDHPAHHALLEWLMPMIEALELDFEAPAD
jgi:Stress responsive A/B Barrel Domain